MARPNNREARITDALDAALKIMNRDGVHALVSLLSVEKVVREAGLSDTARRDWEGVRGAGILQSLSTARLNDWAGSGAGDIAEALFASYPDPGDERSLRERFLDLLSPTTSCRSSSRPTIPVWMVHVAAAAASPLRGAAASGDSAGRDLAELRRQFYGEMAALYGMVLDTFLADMGWRPDRGVGHRRRWSASSPPSTTARSCAGSSIPTPSDRALDAWRPRSWPCSSR